MVAAGSGGGGDIGAESERRLKKAMDKLYHFPKSKTSGASSKPSSSSTSAPSFGRAGADAARRFGVVLGSRLPPQLAAMAAISPPPPCRSWDRADLMRRLASFKAMTWFAKPKVISPVNCARRGWINIEPDVITCEACGARLLFSTPSSWTTQQVEKAAVVFSLKLDTGHKLLCPWIDNICDESLALFPPTPPPVLVKNYYECFSSLMRLSALPRISCSSLEIMKKRAPQLEQFLSEPFSSSIILKGKFMLTEDSTVKDLDDAFQDAEAYYRALKIISLCGWEPRVLSYAIDCGTNSHSHANPTSKLARPEQLSKSVEDRVILYSPNDVNRASASAESNQEDERYDPLSVVLDCQFCGACVALWPFSLVERPLQLFKLVSDSRQDDQDNGNASLVSGVEPSKSANIGFNFTIAGGPPPTRQSFRPKVSLPIVSRHLKADLNSRGIFHSSGGDSHIVPAASYTSGPLKRKRSMDQPQMLEVDDTTSNNFDKSSKETNHDQPGDNSVRSTTDSKVSTEQKQGGSHSDTDKGTNVCEASNEEETTGSLINTDVAAPEQQRPEPISPPVEGVRVENSDAENLTETHAYNSMATEVSIVTKSFLDREKGGCKPSEKQGLYDRLNEFDPIKQHRTFCPWIAHDDGESLPGWRLTLLALLTQDRRSDGKSRVEVQPRFLDEEDDPVTSVRNLFMSPPPKRLRLHLSEKS